MGARGSSTGGDVPAQRSPAAALPANSSASRVCTRSISSDLWPVWSQTFIRLTPRFTAPVTTPHPQTGPTKCRGVEAKLGGGSLDDAGYVARSESLTPHPLGPPIENAP